MPKIHLDPQFEIAYKKFTKKNPKLIRKIDKAILFLSTNPQHPSLHLEKLVGLEIWSVRISRGDRIFLIWNADKSVAILFYIGKHDAYRNV